MANRLGIALALTLVGGLALAATADDEVVARWRGGELTVERFRSLYDPDGEALRAGGAELAAAVCKASFLEIYQPRALAAQLDLDPGFQAELAAWQERQLAALYRRRHAPAGQVAEDQLRQAYEAGAAAGRFDRAATVDLDVLFVRCAADDAGRRSCRERLAALSDRLVSGEPLAALIAEEKNRSGDANGSFRGLAEAKLAPELRAAVAAAALGELGPAVELASGLARLRVVARHPATTLPFASVRAVLEREAAAERLARWEAGQLERWRAILAERLAADAAPDAVLAAAARAEALDREAAFVAAERSARDFALADRAFLADSEVLPSDEELLAQLRDPVRGAAHRRLRLAVAVAPAAAGRAAMEAAASALAARLAAAADRGAALAAAAAADAGLVVRELDPLSAKELRTAWPAAAAVVDQLERQGWAGPLGLAEAVTPQDGVTLPAGAAVLVLRAAAPPPLDEVRAELYRDFRYWLGALEPFREVMGRRWGFELIAADQPGWPQTAAAAASGGRR